LALRRDGVSVMSGPKAENPPIDPADAEDPMVTASRRATAASDDGEEENEVLRETRRAHDLREKAERAARKVGWKAAAGIGIGSAAVLAAALYASRKKD
jgi:hypothetical protein